MAQITGTEMIVRNGKALGAPPTLSASGNIDLTSNVITRKEVWLNNIAEYEALSNPDPNTDYHVKGNYPASFTANRVIVTDSNGSLVSSGITDTELGYLDGLSKNITQYFANKTYSSSTAVDNMKGGAYDGAYWLSSTQWSGMPVGSYGYLEVMGSMQRWTAYGTSNAAKTMTRMYINNTWTPWKYVNEGHNSYSAWVQSTSVSVANNSYVTIISDMELTAGVWVVNANVQWAGNVNGNRRAIITNSSTGTAATNSMVDTRPAATSGDIATHNNFGQVINLTASTTFWLRAYQTSGGSLNVAAARVSAARIL